MEQPTLTLYADGLCSKFGFNDGDWPEDLLEYWVETGVDLSGVEWHEALRKLVRIHLIPAMEAAGHTVEVYNIETVHNPIRARMIDGVEYDGRRAPSGGLSPESVTVPYAAIAAACGIAPPVHDHEGNLD